MTDKQEVIDIIETVYRGASKGRGLVVSPRGELVSLPCANDRLFHATQVLECGKSLAMHFGFVLQQFDVWDDVYDL